MTTTPIEAAASMPQVDTTTVQVPAATVGTAAETTSIEATASIPQVDTTVDVPATTVETAAAATTAVEVPATAVETAAAAAAALSASGVDAETSTEATFAAAKQWHTSPHNPARSGKPLRPETAEGHLRRLRTIGVACLEDWHDPNGKALMTVLDRQLADGRSTGTRRLLCDAVLFYLKYAHAATVEDAQASYRLQRAMESVRRVRNTLQAKYAVELKARSDKAALEDGGRWCDWSEIVKASHALVRHFHTMRRALQRASDDTDSDGDFDVDECKVGQSLEQRTALAGQRALLAMLYTAMPPARGLELRTLEVEVPERLDSATLEKNWIAVDGATGDLMLRLGRFKTVGSHGVQTVPLPTTDDFVGIVEDVVRSKRLRRQLLQRRIDHGFVFCQPNTGAPFTSSDTWSNYVVAVFREGLELCGSECASRSVSINILRKSFLTSALPNAKTVPERESLASAMRHSTKTQMESYNAATASERVRDACGTAARMFEEAGGGGSSSSSVHTSAVSTTVTDVSTGSGTVLSEQRIVSRVLGVRRRKSAGAGVSGEVVEYLVQWFGASSDTDATTWLGECETPVKCVREFYECDARAVRQRVEG